MLTLKEINEIAFRKTNFSGYKPEDVNQFIDDVVGTVESLIEENKNYKEKTNEIAQKNIELREKLQILARKVESYKDEEDGIKRALLSAQKLGNASVKEAKVSAGQILQDANSKADAMVEEAKKKTTKMIQECDDKIQGKEKELEVIKEQVTNFRASLFEIYRKHITVVEEIPDFSEEIKSKREAQRVEEIKTISVEKPMFEEKTIEMESLSNIEVESEIEELEEINDEMFEEIKQEESVVEKNVFPEIDFNAYSNIPEALKREKSELFNALEFGENIDIKSK